MPQKPLKDELFEEPFRFEFFQAVRLFERVFPGRKPVGRGALPHEEVARFTSRIALDFPASELYEVREVTNNGTGETHTEVEVNFMGMAGVSGVLPIQYTELALDRVRHRDTTLASFLDMFTHRAVSLFYRAWEKYRFPVAYERGDDQFTSYLFDNAGMGTKGLRNRMHIQDEALLPYGGLIAQKPHSANALENIVSDYFGVAAKILQFFGQWITLDPADRTRVGTRNSELGVNAIAGARIWDQQSKFRMRLGPLNFNQFQAFLPNGTAHKPFSSIVKFMVGTEIDFDVQLVLMAKQVPGSILTTRALRRPMLGWTSFLKTQPFKKDDDQVVLAIES
ncbi:MAG: type VI secretion system baseplate subunit TssG [Acidobacteriota bacterium]